MKGSGPGLLRSECRVLLEWEQDSGAGQPVPWAKGARGLQSFTWRRRWRRRLVKGVTRQGGAAYACPLAPGMCWVLLERVGMSFADSLGWFQGCARGHWWSVSQEGLSQAYGEPARWG
jgi:hypothetical protein